MAKLDYLQGQLGARRTGILRRVEVALDRRDMINDNTRVTLRPWPEDLHPVRGRLNRVDLPVGTDREVERVAELPGLATARAPLGEEPAVAGGDGLTLSYGSAGAYSGWDRFGRVLAQTWTVDDDPVDSYGYAYDRNSNRTARTNVLKTNHTLDETYAYDGLDRLTGMERGTITSQGWGLDALGNWASFDDNGASQDRSHDAANQVTDIQGEAGWVVPAYDAAGNVIYAPRPGQEADADEALLFVYDGWNRLVKVCTDDGESQGVIDESDTLVATYEYDGLGRRIQKTVGETTDDYYYNESWQVLEPRRGGDPDPLDQYVWDVRYVDAPVVRFHDGNTDGDLDGGAQEGDNTLHYTTDANWNVTALVDAATGAVVERYMYDAYGKVTILDGTTGGQTDWATDADQISDVANDVLFAGYRFDAETGLYATETRIYHPTLGAWLSRDAGYIDTPNLYQYCRSDPAGLTDPTGLCAETAPMPGGLRWDIYLLPYLGDPASGGMVAVPLASSPTPEDPFVLPESNKRFKELFPPGDQKVKDLDTYIRLYGFMPLDPDTKLPRLWFSALVFGVIGALGSWLLDSVYGKGGAPAENPGGAAETKPAAAREAEIQPGKTASAKGAMSEADAITHVRGGGDVMAAGRDQAWRIATKAGDGAPEWHGPHQPGERPHFHPTVGGRPQKPHVMY